MEVFDTCALAGPMSGLLVATQKIWPVLGPYLAEAHTIIIIIIIIKDVGDYAAGGVRSWLGRN